jgi:hypothetical protein
MSYADGLLATGERVVHREKQHWWVFVWGARFTILAVVIAIIFFFLGGTLEPSGVSGTARTILGWVTAVLFVGGLALLFWTTLRYLNQEYVLTNRRVIQVEGVVNKRAVDSSLEKINDAVLEQSIFGRMLGFGDLRILTASEAAISDFKMLVRPVEFKKAMLEAKHEYERDVAGGSYDAGPPLRTAPVGTFPPASNDPDATSVTAAPAAAGVAAAAPDDDDPDEIARTLASLADLRDRGAISAEEYEAKKQDLLSRL